MSRANTWWLDVKFVERTTNACTHVSNAWWLDVKYVERCVCLTHRWPSQQLEVTLLHESMQLHDTLQLHASWDPP